MKISRRQLYRLIRESLLVEAKELTAALEKDLKLGLEKVISDNKGRSEPNILLPYRSGRNNTAHDKVVSGLQAFLKDKGVYTMAIDGDWGNGTTGALKKFQKANLDEVDYEDGKLGPKTSRAIMDMLKVPADTQTSSRKLSGRDKLNQKIIDKLTDPNTTLASKEAYAAKVLKYPLSDEEKAGIRMLLKQAREEVEMDDIVRSARSQQVSDLIGDITGATGRKEAYEKAIEFPDVFSKNVFEEYKSGELGKKSSSASIVATGVQGLDYGDDDALNALIDVRGVQIVNGTLMDGADELIIPFKDGHRYVYKMHKGKGTVTLDTKKSKQYSKEEMLKDPMDTDDGLERLKNMSLREGRRFGESRGTLYRKRYRR